MNSDSSSAPKPDFAALGAAVWIVESAKVRRYLLDPSHPEGGPKARFLMRFGFSQDKPDALAIGLVVHAARNAPGVIVAVPKGAPRRVFEGPLLAPDGRDMPLRTVWEARRGGAEMRFITAVPLTR